MAKARIAAKNAPAAKPTANTVSKPAPQQAQARQSAPAPTQGKPMPSNPQGMRQQGVGKSANDLSRNTTGSSTASASRKIDGAGLANKMRAQNNQSSGGGSNIKTMPGSGKPIPKGADVTQKTTTNDQGQKVTRTTVKTSGSSTDGFANDPDKKAQLMDIKNRRRQRQGLPPIESGNTSSSSSKTIGVDQSAGKSDTKSLVNPNKKQNVKNAKNLKKDFTKVDKQTSSMSIDKEPKAQVDVGSFSGPGGF